MICTVPIYKKGIHLINSNYVSSATGYGVGTFIILFTMSWGIHPVTVLAKIHHAIKQEGYTSLEMTMM